MAPRTRSAFFPPLLFAALLLAAPAVYAFKHVEVGQAPEDFMLENLAGGSGSLNASKGASATAVVFWAAWSPRSAEVLADVEALYKEHAASGFGAVGVNVEHPEWNPAEVDKIRDAAKASGAGYPILLDKDYSIFNRFGVVAIPSTMVLDGQGKVTMLVTSYSTGSKTDLRDEVLRLLGKLQAPAVASTVETGHKTKGKAVRFLNQGRLLKERKQYTRAVEPLREVLAEDPECVEAYKLLAEIYDKLGNAAEAATALKRVQELESAAPAAAPEPPAQPAAPGEKDAAKGNHTSVVAPSAPNVLAAH